MEELEFVQKKLLKALIEETEKKENQQNKLLINQLSKTIGENSKVLSEFGMAPPLLSRIKSLIMIKHDAEKNNDNEEIRRLKILHQTLKVDSIFHGITKKLLENAMNPSSVLKIYFYVTFEIIYNIKIFVHLI